MWLKPIANHKSSYGWWNTQGEIRTYHLNPAHEIVSLYNTFSTGNLSTLQSFDFSPSSEFVFYERQSTLLVFPPVGNNNGKSIRRLNIHTQNDILVLTGKNGEIRRAKNQKLYVMDNNLSTTIVIHTPEAPLIISSNPTILAAPWKTTRGMSLNPHRISIFDDSYITREMHLKNYEISDHLGNVRAVVSDLKEPSTLMGDVLLRHYDFNDFSLYNPSGSGSYASFWAGNRGGELKHQNDGRIRVDRKNSGTDDVFIMRGQQYSTIIGQQYKLTVDFDTDGNHNAVYARAMSVSPSSVIASASLNLTVGNIIELTFTATSTSTILQIYGQSSDTTRHFFVDKTTLVKVGAGGPSEFEPVVATISNYYPFGSPMPGRNFSSGDYRYGFNGMEKDAEIKGEGNSYTTEFRQYDPRLGRWLSMDPKTSKYPSESPYVAFHNNPIYWTDPRGDDPPYKVEKGVLKGDGVVNDITTVTARPKMKVINAVVLHRTVSSSASSAVKTTKNNKGKTGFHIVVDNDGTITQVNNFENRANHVGKQKGDVGNFNSIGIEVVGNYNSETKTWDPLTDEQIENTAQALVSILIEYDLTIDDVYPHEDVSWKTPGEGEVVEDAISNRVNDLYPTAKAIKDNENRTNPAPVDSSLEGVPEQP